MAYSIKRFSKKEISQIRQVTARWMEIESELQTGYTHFDLESDIKLLRRSFPLEYDRLAAASKADFIKEVNGIRGNIDRERIDFRNGFVPTYLAANFAKVRELDFYEKIADNIRCRSIELKKPSYQIARECGVHDSTVHNIAARSHRPSLELLRKIATSLETSVSELIDDKE